MSALSAGVAQVLLRPVFALVVRCRVRGALRRIPVVNSIRASVRDCAVLIAAGATKIIDY